MIIAIDGGAASGKSAVSRRVADRLKLPYVDSGLMYRAITRLALEKGLDTQDAASISALAETTDIRIEKDRVFADGVELTKGIYGADLTRSLPLISAIAGVRVALVAKQRVIGSEGVVMAGRDIGTVVFPEADYKFFLVASLEEKVRRRAAQLKRRGEKVDEEAMRVEVEARDRIDTERAVAPLRAADDAVVIDTDSMTVNQVVERVVRIVEAGRIST